MIMKLRLAEFAQTLGIPASTIERWIRQGRIPVRKKGDQCVFSRSTLEKWAAANHLNFNLSKKAPAAASADNPKQEHPLRLRTVMERGGIAYGIKGSSVDEVLSSAVAKVSGFETPERQEALLDSLKAREQLMSTGIGKGVAIPHPRTPLKYDDIPAVITTCFLEAPIDYHAVDQEPVFVLFLLVSPSSKLHLHLLAQLSFCLRDASFLAMLRNKPDPETLLDRISEFDSRFDASR